jgi:DNA-binding NarL/FixJ family response regulator
VIRVAIVDDHGIVRAGLAELLDAADDIEVVGTAADGAEGVRLAAETGPDVMIMDLSMPALDGIEATRQITATDGAPRVVVLTSFADQDRILGALDAGAIGYLLKDAEPAEVFRAVRAAARGESPLDPRAASAVLAARTARAPAAGLSGREREVLELVSEGMANKRIAQRLHISEKTVKAHLTRVFLTLGVSDRTQAALWVHRRGLPPAAR